MLFRSVIDCAASVSVIFAVESLPKTSILTAISSRIPRKNLLAAIIAINVTDASKLQCLRTPRNKPLGRNRRSSEPPVANMLSVTQLFSVTHYSAILEPIQRTNRP